jgi:hypothetical protein
VKFFAKLYTVNEGLLYNKNRYIRNMRKSIILTVLFLICLPVFADDFFDTYTGVDNAWDGQKAITNKEFEKAIDTLTEKQQKKEARQRKRKIRKHTGGGTSLHAGLEPMSEINAQDSLKNKDKNEGQLLNIPVEIVVDGQILEPGFYNIFGEKDEKNNVYLSFYQSQYFKGKVKAYKTNDDYDSDSLDFVKFIPYDENYIKIIFGSLDFNAYAYVKYYEK